MCDDDFENGESPRTVSPATSENNVIKNHRLSEEESPHFTGFDQTQEVFVNKNPNGGYNPLFEGKTTSTTTEEMTSGSSGRNSPNEKFSSSSFMSKKSPNNVNMDHLKTQDADWQGENNFK